MGLDFKPKALRKSTNKSKSMINETKVADRLDMTLTRGSGSQPTDRGDMYSEKFLVEKKQTCKPNLTISSTWLNKIQHEANQRNRYWALYIAFTDESNTINNEGVVISPQLFNRLREFLYDNCD